ncbi:Plasmodium exported protein, unknown function [Plasmodium sp.]|nr:Plasmodium exported protein, unknown function [Plasmodium sp.]
MYERIFENVIVNKDRTLTIRTLLPIRLLTEINSNKLKYTKLHKQDPSRQQTQGNENKNDFMFIQKLVHEQLQKYDSDKYLHNERNANNEYTDYKKEFDSKHIPLDLKFNIKHIFYKKFMKYFLKKKVKKHFQKMVKKLFSMPKKPIKKDISHEQIKPKDKPKTRICREASTYKTMFLSSILSSVSIGCYSLASTVGTCPIAFLIIITIIGIVCVIIILILLLRLFIRYPRKFEERTENYSEEEYSNE